MSFKPNFVATLPVTASSADPTQARRNALLVRLQDQKALAQDPNHQRSFKVRKKDPNGNTVFETQTANIRQSWRDSVFFVRIGTGQLLELAKGQPGISFKNNDELVQAIDWTMAQVAAGAYDKQMAAAGRPGKRKATTK